MVAWFDEKFEQEVTDLLVGEKVLKRFEPWRAFERSDPGQFDNIQTHIDYIGWLAERRAWLGGDSFFSIAGCDRRRRISHAWTISAATSPGP